MDGSNGIAIDAVPQKLPITYIENECHKFNKIEDILSEFSAEDYKSAFFLLMDYISVEKFFELTSKDVPSLDKCFCELYRHKPLDERLLVELLGVLKMYKKLRKLGTCSHVYESKEKYCDRIHRFWKMLYALCEELTDDELTALKLNVESDSKDKILSTEDWFCWAFMKKLFSKTNISYLEETFRLFPRCLAILKSYKDSRYNVTLPTSESDCGVALILNYEEFNNNTCLQKRQYSHKDVDSLKRLWDMFGFQVEVYSNLTYEETFEKMEQYGSRNYSHYDVFVCCILSHGDLGGIYSSDGELMKITELMTPIVHCLSLEKKPKLFFIQACQGQNIPGGVGNRIYRIPTVDVKPPKKRYSKPPPILTDTLEVKSSIDGYVSFIDDEGSWFIQSLCKHMMQDGENSSVEEVITMVQGEVKNYSIRLDQLARQDIIQIVNPNEYFDNFEQSNEQMVTQLVVRNSTLDKKLFLKKRVN